MPQLLENQLSGKVREWFDGFMHQLRTDRMLLEENVAHPQTQAFYERLANGSTDDLAMSARAHSTTHFLGSLIVDYVQELRSRHCQPLKLALDLSNAKVLVWAEINDDDEATEDQLRLAEAKINARFSQYGFHLTSTIVERSDYLAVPSHYQSILN